jgi:hypothetical protein
MAVHVGFVVEKVALGHVILPPNTSIFLSGSFHRYSIPISHSSTINAGIQITVKLGCNVKTGTECFVPL